MTFSYKPSQLMPDPGGMLVGTLGSAETEFLGALIIRWHNFHNYDEWMPVSRRDLMNLFTEDDVAKSWTQNPFWKPDLRRFQSEGFIEGWDHDAEVKGTLTEKFFAGLQRRISKEESRNA